LFISVEPSHLSEIGRNAEVDERHVDLLPVRQIRDRTILRIGRELLRERLGGIGDPLYTESLLTQLGIHLFRNYSVAAPRSTPALESPRSRRAPRIDEAVQLIHDELETSLPLARLAAVAGLSTYHFIRVFKRVTGESPHRYVLRVRTETARRLLLETTRSPADIAAAVGFADQSHLAFHLRRAFETTVSELRRSRKKSR
jgi:AraC family transcriptional regulator